MLNKTCLWFIALCAPVLAEACIKHDVQKVLAPFEPHLIAGIEVFSPTSQATLFQHNATKLFHPGSNTKLFTTYVGLKTLGPDHQIKTSLHYDSNIDNHQLKSDVILKFQGDPTLSYEDYLKFFEHLKQQGIQSIKGDFVLDDGAFQGKVYSPGVTWDDFDWAFAPPTHAYSFEDNRFDIEIMPAKTLNQAAKATAKKFSNLINIQADIKTVSQAQAQDCSFDIQQQGNQFKLTGCWPISESTSTVHLANRDLKGFMPHLIQHLLKSNGIKLKGNVVYAKKDLPEQASHLSPKLSEIVYFILRDSNDLYADSLVRTLGLHQADIGSLHEGMKVIRNVLKKDVGLDDSYVLEDGSGLSHYNLVSPHHLSRLLDVASSEPFYESFKDSLPQPFKRGNLRERLHSVDVKDKVFAKTGTLSGHSTLCGYLVNHQGQQLNFSLLLNNSQLPNRKLTQIEDQLVIALHKADVE